MLQKPAGDCENILVDLVTSEVYFVVKRPLESKRQITNILCRTNWNSTNGFLLLDGRSVIISALDGTDIFGKGWDARTGVQEYGGAAAVANGDLVYFSHFADGRVYKCDRNSVPVPVTPGMSLYHIQIFLH